MNPPESRPAAWGDESVSQDGTKLSPGHDAASLPEKRAEAEDYLDWFRHQASPRTLSEANVIADALATLLEEVLGGDDANAASLHLVQADVEAFHRALDIPVGDSPAIRRPELRAELIREEARETVEAIERGDLIEAIDGLCDLLCVVYGAAAEFGVNLAPFWNEVHQTNMAKVGGPVREDGKRLKPEGWTPPDIKGVLARVAA